MRKVIFYLVVAMSALFVSCSGNGPEAAAKNFVEHTSKGEFAEAKKYCTERTAAMVSMLEGMAGEKAAEMKEKNKDIKVNIVSSEIKEDKAKVKYTVSGGEGGDSSEKELDLVKEEDEWKVDMNKEGSAPAE